MKPAFELVGLVILFWPGWFVKMCIAVPIYAILKYDLQRLKSSMNPSSSPKKERNL